MGENLIVCLAPPGRKVRGRSRVSKLLLALALFAVLSSSVYAGDGYEFYVSNPSPWKGRGRVGFAAPNYSESYTLNGVKQTGTIFTLSDGDSTDIASLGFYVDGEMAYHFTDKLAFSMGLGYITQTSNILDYGGTTDNGRLRIIPLTAMVQFYPTPYGKLQPYMGVGVHYTKILTSFDLAKFDDSTGFVLEGGFDYWLSKQYAFNFNMRYFDMSTEGAFDDWTTPDTSKGEFDINPLTVVGGVTYRF